MCFKRTLFAGGIRQKMNDPSKTNAGSIEDVELGSIIDSNAIQSIMDDFYRLTGIGVAIVDLKGNILVATGWQDICTRFHRVHPETAARCMESDLTLSHGVPRGEIKHYKCENNLSDIVTPIFIGDKHMGNLFLGQFFFEDEVLDYDLFDRQADQYGFDKAEYRAALDRVPRWSRERVNTVMRFYRRLADMISGLSFSNLSLARELTERKRIEAVLSEKKAFLEAQLYSSIDGILVVDSQGKKIFQNQRTVELWKIPKEIADNPDDQLQVAHVMHLTKDPDQFVRQIKYLYSHPHETSRDEIELKDGTVLDRYSAPVIGSDGRNYGRIWSFRDITERKQMEEALRESERKYRELSILDGLTQLYNSRYFYQQLYMEIDRVKRYGQPLTLLFLDLDNFKAFNDIYGHIEGDQVLFRIGEVVKKSLRTTDSAYRYGGEEFIIMLPMTTSAAGAVTAERIRTEFKKETFIPDKKIHLTLSIGVGQYRTQEDMKTFVHRVDQLMYRGKENGKDRICRES